MRELGDVQRYLIEEFVEDWREGHMSRRDMVRRIVYITGGAASAATVLVSLGCAPAAPTAAPTRPAAAATTAPAPTTAPAATTAPTVAATTAPAATKPAAASAA